METKERRHKYDICAQILEACANSQVMLKSHILRDCSLSGNQLYDFLSLLINKSLLKEIPNPKIHSYKNTKKSVYLRTTNKGREFLKTYSRLKMFLEGDEVVFNYGG